MHHSDFFFFLLLYLIIIKAISRSLHLASALHSNCLASKWKAVWKMTIYGGNCVQYINKSVWPAQSRTRNACHGIIFGRFDFALPLPVLQKWGNVYRVTKANTLNKFHQMESKLDKKFIRNCNEICDVCCWCCCCSIFTWIDSKKTSNEFKHFAQNAFHWI